MKSAAIRQAFLQYFAAQDHEVVPSSSLIPGADPTLLFTNAGMVQFKDVFLGQENRPYRRAASSQRCVRAGGKHNDLENVGYTARHHTFFEMLGNFSFGDYFKREAIRFAWNFLTHELKLPPERLWVTVHVSDDEAAAIWLNEIGIDPTRFSRLDEDNFWQMGDTGPCGPSSEIFYDHGAHVAGGPPGSEGDHLDRYIEIWNLVFMQFERQASGELKPLPKPSVDTGMGLERIAAVMQGVHSNYEIDLFQNLIKSAAAVTGAVDLGEQSLRVIADHIRSCSFLINDGVVPGNEGRGYVLRRIIRRALRHGHKLGASQAFFHKLVAALVTEMGDAYPDLVQNRAHIERVLLAEEEQFSKTLDKGLTVLDGALADLQGQELSGELVFTLYDTYGFPADLTADIARERGLSLDMAGFDARMAQQKARGRAGSGFKHDYSKQVLIDGETRFAGYERLEEQGVVAAIVAGGERVEVLEEGAEAAIALDHTPFYAESGGQVGDSGYLETASGARFEVRDCQKAGAVFLHVGQLLHGRLASGETVRAKVSPEVRSAIARNHSATHLLHAALREVLGAHVAQKGSLVDSERLRFDFAHYEALTPQQLRSIEARVNDEIMRNSAVVVELMDQAAAKARGAMALFGEKYGDTVRVLTMGEGFSVELCGGTHVTRTGDIGLFKIVTENGIAAGVRRIEAISGTGAFALLDSARNTLLQLAAVLKVPEAAVIERVEALVASNRQLEKTLASARSQAAVAAADDWLAEAVSAGPVRLLTKVVDDLDPKLLRDLADRLKQKLAPAAVILGSRADGKVALVASVSQDAVRQVKAGDLLKFVTERAGGKGGGRPDMAQGSAPAGAALESALGELAQRLAAGGPF